MRRNDLFGAAVLALATSAAVKAGDGAPVAPAGVTSGALPRDGGAPPSVVPQEPGAGRGDGDGAGGGRRGKGLASAETLEVKGPSAGDSRTLRCDAIRSAARAKVDRDGHETTITPLMKVLADGGVGAFRHVRAVGEEDVLDLHNPPTGDWLDARDWGVAFNRRGLPILMRLPPAATPPRVGTSPTATATPEPAAGAGQLSEVRRLVRLEARLD